VVFLTLLFENDYIFKEKLLLKNSNVENIERCIFCCFYLKM